MKSLRYLNKYFYKYKKHFLGGIFFIIISNLFGIFPAKLIRYGFNTVEKTIYIYRYSKRFPNQSEILKEIGWVLFFLALAIILMSILKGIFLFFTRQTIIVMSRFIEYDLKNEIFNQYQNLDISFYKRNKTGDLINRISEDVSRVRMYLGPAIMYIINLIVLFILVTITMLTVNVKLTLYVLTPLPILSISIYYVSNKIHKKSEKVQRQLSVLTSFIQETFSGIRILKSFNIEKIKNKKFEQQSVVYRNENLALVKINAFFMPLIILLIGLSTIITIYIGGLLTIDGEITTGNIIEFVIYVNMLTWPTASIGWVTSLTQRAIASQERINEFLYQKGEITNNSEHKIKFQGDIKFQNVSYTYKDTQIQALNNVSFKIKKGSSLAILGHIGSGKTTIANLLCRLFDVDSGMILIDEKNIKDINLYDLRNQIGYIPQEVFLFSDTIRNNIIFGINHNNVEDVDIYDVAKQSDVYHNIIDFPEQFETKIGEKGITLSGGQKQRISVSRGIIKSPKILIIDDSLSAIDSKTEKKIIYHFKKIMKDKTTIMISHRVSTIQHCDQIIVLENGKIIEKGSHQKLLSNKKLYYNFYKKQNIESMKSIK